MSGKARMHRFLTLVADRVPLALRDQVSIRRGERGDVELRVTLGTHGMLGHSLDGDAFHSMTDAMMQLVAETIAEGWKGHARACQALLAVDEDEACEDCG